MAAVCLSAFSNSGPDSIREEPAQFTGITAPSILSTGRPILHKINLVPGEFVEIVPGSSVDLHIKVMSPDQRVVGEWYVAHKSAQPVAWLSDLPGLYLLQVSVLKGAYESQVCTLSIASKRMATPADTKLVLASRLYSDAVRLNREWTRESLLQSVEKYRRALDFLKDGSQRASVLCQLAEVYALTSQPEKASEVLFRARAGDLKPEVYIRVLNLIGKLERRNSNYTAATAYFSEALEVSQSMKDVVSEAESRCNLGYLHYLLSQYEDAQNNLWEALRLCESAHAKLELAQIHLFLGYTFHALRETRDAAEHYRQSLQLGMEAEDPDAQATARLALGHLMIVVGEWQKGFAYYDEAIHLSQVLGDNSTEASALQGMAYGYRALGMSQRALNLYEKSIAISDQLKSAYVVHHTHGLIAQLYQELGNFRQAAFHCQLALKENTPYLKASVLATLGKVYEKQGRITDSRSSYERALKLSRQMSDRFMEGLLLNVIGRSYLAQGENQRALNEYFKRALSLQQLIGDVVNTPATLYNIALAEHMLNHPDASLSNITEAINLTESQRVKVAGQEFRAYFNASVNEIHKFAIDRMMELNGLKPNAGWDEAALQASERARARSLLESLVEKRAEISQGVDPELLKREGELQEKLNGMAEAQINLGREPHTREQEQLLSREIGDLTSEINQIRELIRARSPHYASLTQPQPLTFQQIRQEVLDPDTLLLEYSLGEESSYLWAATDNSLESYKLPGRSAIEVGVRKVARLMLARQDRAAETASAYQARINNADAQYRVEAARLSRELLGPAAHLFTKKRLLIVAEGDLQHLSFGALPDPGSVSENARDNAGFKPLIIEHEIVKLPSASVLAVLRRETKDRPVPSKMLAVFADPVYERDDPRMQQPLRGIVATSAKHRPENVRSAPVSVGQVASLSTSGNNTKAVLNKAKTRSTRSQGPFFSRIPGTRTEADGILGFAPEELRLTALDFEASRSAVLSSQLEQYRVIHFATHGTIHSEFPELSGLALSSFDRQGRPLDGNGILRLSDIYNLNLPVELVVLSACNSGLGTDIRGEGLVGIVRGFMYAGAARVVASLWKVEDEATAELMKRFYRHMFEKGEPAAAALRSAQIEISQQKRWNAPYFWAAFVLQGEWK